MKTLSPLLVATAASIALAAAVSLSVRIDSHVSGTARTTANASWFAGAFPVAQAGFVKHPMAGG